MRWCSSISAGTEFAPDGLLLEDAGVVVLAQLVLGSAPPQAVVPETCESTIGDRDHQGQGCHKEQVRDPVIDDESL